MVPLKHVGVIGLALFSPAQSLIGTVLQGI